MCVCVCVSVAFWLKFKQRSCTHTTPLLQHLPQSMAPKKAAKKSMTKEELKLMRHHKQILLKGRFIKSVILFTMLRKVIESGDLWQDADGHAKMLDDLCLSVNTIGQT